MEMLDLEKQQDIPSATRNTLRHNANAINASLAPVGYSVPSSRVVVALIEGFSLSGFAVAV
jgi:hypothetical protein